MSNAIEDRNTEHAQVEEFVGRALGDLAGTMTVALASIGDRVGLFRALDGAGWITAADVARRAEPSVRRVPLDNPFNNLFEAVR